MVVLREMITQHHAASGIETLLRCGESILFNTTYPSSSSPSPVPGPAQDTAVRRADSHLISSPWSHLPALMTTANPSHMHNPAASAPGLTAPAPLALDSSSPSPSSPAVSVSSSSSSSFSSTSSPSVPTPTDMPLVRHSHSSASSSSATSSSTLRNLPSQSHHVPPLDLFYGHRSNSREPTISVCPTALPVCTSRPEDQAGHRPVRKQALSFILNGASQDQQQFDMLMNGPHPLSKITPMSPRAPDQALCSTTASDRFVQGPSSAKRTAEQAGILDVDVSHEERVRNPSPPEGTDRKRRRRRHSVPCDLCGRVFGEAAALRKHTRVVHEKKKDFVCADCGRAFAEKSNLKKHAQARHGVAAKPHPCPDCTKIFSFSDGLRRHINNCHLGLRPYACLIEGCGHSFKQRTHLQKHQQSVHGLAHIA